MSESLCLNKEISVSSCVVQIARHCLPSFNKKGILDNKQKISKQRLFSTCFSKQRLLNTVRKSFENFEGGLVNRFINQFDVESLNKSILEVLCAIYPDKNVAIQLIEEKYNMFIVTLNGESKFLLKKHGVFESLCNQSIQIYENTSITNKQLKDRVDHACSLAGPLKNGYLYAQREKLGSVIANEYGIGVFPVSLIKTKEGVFSMHEYDEDITFAVDVSDVLKESSRKNVSVQSVQNGVVLDLLLGVSFCDLDDFSFVIRDRKQGVSDIIATTFSYSLMEDCKVGDVNHSEYENQFRFLQFKQAEHSLTFATRTLIYEIDFDNIIDCCEESGINVDYYAKEALYKNIGALKKIATDSSINSCYDLCKAFVSNCT